MTADLHALAQDYIIPLYILDFRSIGVNLIVRLTNEKNDIVYQGVLYNAAPIEVTDLNIVSNKPASPTLRIGNVTGAITALVLAYSDLRGVKVIRRRVMVKHLSNPLAAYPDDVFFISRKTSETALEISFELSALIDRALRVQIPRRTIFANHCGWIYRSPECGYTGGAVADVDDNRTSDISRDQCGKRTSSCRLRFGNDLPFGAFPGVDAYDF